MERRNLTYAVSYVDSEGKKCIKSFGKGKKGQELAAEFVFWLMDQPENLKRLLAETRNKEAL